MLPPGHVAAGYLTAKALLHFLHGQFSSAQQNHLLWWGVFFGFAPDLDNFVAFAMVKGWWYKPGTDNSIHRKFYSHVPLLWLVAGLLIFFLATSAYVKAIGLLLWLGSWSHFILDSIEYGVMWLWPFNSEVWALKDRGVTVQIPGTNFWSYWLASLKMYTARWTFYAEIIILLAAITVLIRR